MSNGRPFGFFHQTAECIDSPLFEETVFTPRLCVFVPPIGLVVSMCGAEAKRTINQHIKNCTDSYSVKETEFSMFLQHTNIPEVKEVIDILKFRRMSTKIIAILLFLL